MVTKCLLGEFLGGEYRSILYTKDDCRIIIDFANRTLLEVLYYLEITFNIEKETVEMI